MTLAEEATYKAAVLQVLRLPRSVQARPGPHLAAPRLPWLSFGLAVATATVWTSLALTQNNLELQSIDLCHYAMWVDHLRTPLGEVDRAFVGEYPMMSIRVAALWMPLFKNPIMALRAAALACLLVMLIAQWHLLRTRLSGSMAMLVLIAWQCLCTTCKLGDANHFLWEWTYNYSRAVSATALWVMILTFVVPPSRYKLINLLVAIGLAAFAFRCHIAAGSLALATCGTWCLVNLLRRDWLLGAGGLIGLGVTAAMLLAFTDEWRFLASLQHDNCLLAIRNESLIAMWIPTAIIGLGIALWKVWRRNLDITLTTAVLCGLLPAAVLQGYMLYGKNVTRTIGSYPYNQMLFYTFGLASLLWVAGAIHIITRGASRGTSTPPACASGYDQTLRQLSAALNVIAILAAGWGVYVMLETDARRSRVEHDRDPIVVLNNLRPHRNEFIGHYYYDPDLEHASYFVSRCVVGAGSDVAARYRGHLHARKPWDLFREPGLKGILLPASVDPATILGPECPVTRVGNFWKCDLETYRKSAAFELAANRGK